MARINIPTSHAYVRTAKLNRREASVNGVAVAEYGRTKAVGQKHYVFNAENDTRFARLLHIAFHVLVEWVRYSYFESTLSYIPKAHVPFEFYSDHKQWQKSFYVNYKYVGMRMLRAYALCYHSAP